MRVTDMNRMAGNLPSFYEVIAYQADQIDELVLSLRHARYCATCAESAWADCEEGRKGLKVLKQH